MVADAHGRPVYVGHQRHAARRVPSRRDRRRGGLTATRGSVRRPDRPATGDIRAAASLVEDGVNVQMDAYGLLNNIADAPKVAPMQPWALGLYRMRQSTFLQRDPMFLGCKPPGGPRQFQQPYGFQFVEQPDFKRVFVLLGGGNRNRRIIYTDGRKQVGQIQGNDDNPLFYGHAGRPLGRRHVRRRHARVQRGVLVRQRRPAAHRAAPPDRAVHAHRHGHDAVRSDD